MSQKIILPRLAGIMTSQDPVTQALTIDLGDARAGEVSDGYHTFDELYQHRMALTLQLMKAYPDLSFKSKQHHPEGEPMFKGFFIVGMTLPSGQISYHYKLEHWDAFSDIREIEYAPLWDGHTPADVVIRLMEWDGQSNG